MSTTEIWLLCLGGMLLLLELWTLRDKGPRSPTISRVVRNASLRWPLLLLLVGILLGHWFWPMGGCP